MRIRSQVLAAYAPPARSPFALNSIRLVVRWGVAAGLALVFLFVGLRPAVLASVPGETLYPLKQAVEQVELQFAPSAQDRAFVHLAHAERRAQEALTLVERGQLASGIMTDALDELITAAEIARTDTNIGSNVILQLEARTVQVNTLVIAVLTLADQSDQIPQESVTDLAQRIQATQTSGDLLLPAAATPTPLPSNTPTPTAEPSAAASPTLTPMALSPTVTQQLPEATPEASDGPATIVIEGPVEAISVNIITVFSTHIRVDPASPVLREIRIGDTVRVEGTSVMEGDVLVIVAIHITLVEVIVAPDGAPPASSSDDLPPNCKITGMGHIKCTKKSK
jgi:hypothetical protein